MFKFVAAGLAVTALVASTEVAHAAIAESTAGDGDLHLIYAPSTGNLTVAVNGNPYGTVTLSATNSVFKDGVFGTSPEFYSDDNGDGSGLFFGVLVGTQTSDVVLPGVLDLNLSESTLLNSITVSGVTNGPAANKITFSGGTTGTPEPTSVALLGVGAAGVLRRRRTA